MKSPSEAANRARHWLLSLELQAVEQVAYRDLGIALAECVMDGLAPETPQAEVGIAHLPDPSLLITMDRAELLKISRNFTPAATSAADADLAVAQLALVFARCDDLQAAAALLRLATMAGVDEELIWDAWDYVYSQQHGDGFFGMISAELALLDQEDQRQATRLAMTVEVLWALAAASASKTGYRGAAV